MAAGERGVPPPGAIEVMQWLVDLNVRHKVHPLPSDTTSLGAGDWWLLGNIGIRLSGTGTLGQTLTAKPDFEWDMFVTPKHTKTGKRAITANENPMAVTSSTKNPEAAYRFAYVMGDNYVRDLVGKFRINCPSLKQSATATRREWERAVFAVWSARLVEALRRRGLIGVPQGYWVHPKPTTARCRFRHGAIVPHPTPRRGPANYTRRVPGTIENRSTVSGSVEERRSLVPPESLAGFDMVVCAFGGFPPPEAYWPVIALLGARLPFRALAEMVCLLFDQDWAVAFNDAMAKGSVPAPPEEVEAARQRLLRCGYEEWLRRPHSSAP